jgi:hypothetical protein
MQEGGKYPAAQIWERAFGILYDNNGMWVSCEINWFAQATSMQFYNDSIIHVHKKKKVGKHFQDQSQFLSKVKKLPPKPNFYSFHDRRQGHKQILNRLSGDT